MKKPQRKTNHIVLLPYKGLMKCGNGHVWSVSDLNQELITVKCPRCGANTDIKKAKCLIN